MTPSHWYSSLVPIGFWAAVTAFNRVANSRTPQEWVDLFEKSPRLARWLARIRFYGGDPIGYVRMIEAVSKELAERCPAGPTAEEAPPVVKGP